MRGNGHSGNASPIGKANSHGVLSVITKQRHEDAGFAARALTVTSENIRKYGCRTCVPRKTSMHGSSPRTESTTLVAASEYGRTSLNTHCAKLVPNGRPHTAARQANNITTTDKPRDDGTRDSTKASTKTITAHGA